MTILEFCNTILSYSKKADIVADSRDVDSNSIFVVHEGAISYVHNIFSATMILLPHQSDVNVFINQYPERFVEISIDNVAKIDNRVHILSYDEFVYDDVIHTLLSLRYSVPSKTVAITGTNGKTSTMLFAANMLSLLDINNIFIGTLGVGINNIINMNVRDDQVHNLTTPSVDKLYRLLDDGLKNGAEVGLFEASSHALDQRRLGILKVDVAAFTNFTTDHLDYHGNMDEYFNAKIRLYLDHIKQSGIAVINADMDRYDILRNVLQKQDIRILDYGKNANDLRLLSRQCLADVTSASFQFENKIYNFSVNVIGDYQAENILCAIGILISLGYKINDIMLYINKLNTVPGRMHHISSNGIVGDIYIDFAHSVDGLDRVCSFLKQFISGQFTVVTGCNCMSNVEKRYNIGLTLSKYVDSLIVTDDLPHGTNLPEVIRKDVVSGAMAGNANIAIADIADRVKAIHHAIQASKKGDTILIAGMGCGKYQTSDGVMSDIDVAVNFISHHYAQ